MRLSPDCEEQVTSFNSELRFSGKVAEGCEIKTIQIIVTNVLHSNNNNRACIDEGDQVIGCGRISLLL